MILCILDAFTYAHQIADLSNLWVQVTSGSESVIKVQSTLICQISYLKVFNLSAFEKQQGP